MHQSHPAGVVARVAEQETMRVPRISPQNLVSGPESEAFGLRQIADALRGARIAPEPGAMEQKPPAQSLLTGHPGEKTRGGVVALDRSQPGVGALRALPGLYQPRYCFRIPRLL